MHTRVYDKTDKGREEIATRKYQLRSKLRTLLVMIDGRHSLGALLKDFAVLGMSEENVDELLRLEYIVLVGGGPAAEEPAAPASAPRPPASARARMQARVRSHAREGMAQAAAEVEVEVEADIDDEAALTKPEPPADADLFRALHAFYNQTIRSNLGLRGIGLQLDVEKAANVGDLRALRLAYLQAVLKSKGRATALELRERLDALSGGRPEPDNFVVPDDAGAARGVFGYFNLAKDSVNF